MASSGSHAGSVHGIAVERGLNMPSWNFLVASKFDHFGNFVVTKRDLAPSTEKAKPLLRSSKTSLLSNGCATQARRGRSL